MQARYIIYFSCNYSNNSVHTTRYQQSRRAMQSISREKQTLLKNWIFKQFYESVAYLLPWIFILCILISLNFHTLYACFLEFLYFVCLFPWIFILCIFISLNFDTHIWNKDLILKYFHRKQNKKIIFFISLD